MPPGDVLARLHVRPGMRVCDLGAGSGYFALPLAHAVGPQGKVFAVDLQSDMLELLRRKLEQPGAPRNIETSQGDATRTHLPNGCADVVLLANLWHELEDHPAVLREVRRILHPEGQVAVLDWRHDAPHPPGPPLDHRIPMRDAVDTLERNGWRLEHHGPLGSFSYLLVAEIADEGVQS
jgi:ubiquinone/menaquinone biosynthesis C-methylase UbiE